MPRLRPVVIVLALTATGLVALAGAGRVATAVLTRQVETRFPPRGRFVTVEGGRLHVLERGPASTPEGTVLLLHGASGNAEDMMLNLGARLAERYRVLAIDRPGHGWSDRPGGRDDASPARQGALIRQALAQLGVDRALVVGHSWSGALAAHLALAAPDLVSGLVLLAGVTHPWPGGISWYYDVAANPAVGPVFTATVAAPVGAVLLDGAAESVFAPEAAPPDYVERAAVPLVLRPAEFAANAEDVQDLLAFVTAQAPRYGDIRVPTTIIHGDRDTTVSLDIHARALARQLPSARLVVLPGVGHMPHHTQTDLVVREIEGVMRLAPLAAR
jgi:pimeloyl-ACP methyl ester carboxylesterase